jgi:hypothetical protein
MTRATGIHGAYLRTRTAHSAHSAQNGRPEPVISAMKQRTEDTHRAQEPRTPARDHLDCARFRHTACAVPSALSHSLAPYPCHLTSRFAACVRGVRAVRGCVPIPIPQSSRCER